MVGAFLHPDGRWRVKWYENIMVAILPLETEGEEVLSAAEIPLEHTLKMTIDKDKKRSATFCFSYQDQSTKELRHVLRFVPTDKRLLGGGLARGDIALPADFVPLLLESTNTLSGNALISITSQDDRCRIYEQDGESMRFKEEIKLRVSNKLAEESFERVIVIPSQAAYSGQRNGNWMVADTGRSIMAEGLNWFTLLPITLKSPESVIEQVLDRYDLEQTLVSRFKSLTLAWKNSSK